MSFPTQYQTKNYATICASTEKNTNWDYDPALDGMLVKTKQLKASDTTCPVHPSCNASPSAKLVLQVLQRHCSVHITQLSDDDLNKYTKKCTADEYSTEDDLPLAKLKPITRGTRDDHELDFSSEGDTPLSEFNKPVRGSVLKLYKKKPILNVYQERPRRVFHMQSQK